MAESGEVVVKTLKGLLSRLVQLVMKPVRLVREGTRTSTAPVRTTGVPMPRRSWSRARSPPASWDPEAWAASDRLRFGSPASREEKRRAGRYTLRVANISVIVLAIACALVALLAVGVLVTLLVPTQWRTRRTKRDS